MTTQTSRSTREAMARSWGLKWLGVNIVGKTAMAAPPPDRLERLELTWTALSNVPRGPGVKVNALLLARSQTPKTKLLAANGMECRRRDVDLRCRWLGFVLGKKTGSVPEQLKRPWLPHP